MFGFVWWLIVGLAAGVLARLFVPSRPPIGLLMPLLLGLVGSFLGGMISWAIFGAKMLDPRFHAGGLLVSLISAMLVLSWYVADGKESVSR